VDEGPPDQLPGQFNYKIFCTNDRPGSTSELAAHVNGDN